ncbi:hypothetical protein ACR6C2_07865 [Streptomyces sp. INA 01156]
MSTSQILPLPEIRAHEAVPNRAPAHPHRLPPRRDRMHRRGPGGGRHQTASHRRAIRSAGRTRRHGDGLPLADAIGQLTVEAEHTGGYDRDAFRHWNAAWTPKTAATPVRSCSWPRPSPRPRRAMAASSPGESGCPTTTRSPSTTPANSTSTTWSRSKNHGRLGRTSGTLTGARRSPTTSLRPALSSR